MTKPLDPNDPVLESPKGGTYNLKEVLEAARKARSVKLDSKDESRVASEPITVNRALIWTVGILAFVASSAAVAGVTALWTQGQAITRMESNYSALTKQIDSLSSQVTVGTSNRYTASDAATDRAAVAHQMDTLTQINASQDTIISDLRVKVATLEAKVSREHP